MITSINLPSVELVNLTPSDYSPLISKCQVKVCYVDENPNRNDSVIDKPTATKMAPSLRGAAIVGFYNEETQDFEGHERAMEFTEDGDLHFKDITKPYGFVDLNAKVWFQKFIEQGVEREYLMTEGWLWTAQYPECERVLTKGNNQSMELDEETLSGTWSNQENGKGLFFIINDAVISKLCILGQKVEPCFEGAQITSPKIEFSFEENFKNQLFSMMNEIKDILTKGGAPMEDNVIVQEEVVVETNPEIVETEEEIKEEEVVETEFEDKKEDDDEEKEEICEKCGKPVSECTCEDEEDEEEDKKATYNLDEVVEYAELKAQYEALQASTTELEAEISALRSFKLECDRKEKQAMIDSFNMLSDEDKADCVANIDTYSLEDIESKLSVICVRNRVEFKVEESAEPFTYNLNNSSSGSSKPAWIQALDKLNK